MDKTPKKGNEGAPEPERTQPKIMVKPLPEILDDLENYIMRVEEAVRQAQAAARESREAAAQAKLSGERAAEAARKAAEAAVAEVREEATRANDDLSARVDKEISTLREEVAQEAIVIDEAFLTLRDKHAIDSPFLKKKT